MIDPVIYLSIPKNNIKSFMQQGLSDPLISVSQSGVIGVNGWQSNDRSLTNLFSFEKDPSLLNEKYKLNSKKIQKISNKQNKIKTKNLN